jgi:hypothetical protein
LHTGGIATSRVLTAQANRKPMAEPFEGWAILELMGHRKLAGLLSEQTIGGAAFIRIDVPKPLTPENLDALWAVTQFYAPSAVYCITPTSEDLARKVAAGAQPTPVTRYELPAATQSRERVDFDDIDDDGG